MRNLLIRVLLLSLLSLLPLSDVLAQAYGTFQAGGDLTGTWNNQAIAPNAVTFAKMAQQPNAIVPCNASGSTTNLQACNPLAIANLQNAVVSVYAVNTARLLFSSMTGTQTIDSVSVPVGKVVLLTDQNGGDGPSTDPCVAAATTSTGFASGASSIVVASATGFATGQGITGPGIPVGDTIASISGTTIGLSASTNATESSGSAIQVGTVGACDGFWVVNSTAWSRPVNFPNAYVIPLSCELLVAVEAGTSFTGSLYKLSNLTTGSVTIGTTGETWTVDRATASATVYGPTRLTGSAAYAAGTSGLAAAALDCLSAGGTSASNFSVIDNGDVAGNTGPCVLSDANGHPLFDATGVAPTVSGSGCSLTSGGRDNTGSIVATGADTCTLTFGASFTTAPDCTATGVGNTVIPYLNALPSTSAAVFKTTAAGTFTYHCM